MKCILIFLSLFTFAESVLARGRFPKEIAGYQLQEISIYDHSGLGFSIRYEHPDNAEKFDIYFYNRGLKGIGTGLSKTVQKEYDEVFQSIEEMARQGYYSDVGTPDGGTGSIELDGEEVDFLWGTVQFKQTTKASDITNIEFIGTRTSFVFITAYQDRFLKLRYTIDSDDYENGMKLFTEILYQIEHSFAGRELPLKETPEESE